MIRNLLLLCSIALLACSVYGKASIPFQPIHPGALHADLFTPLNKDTVQVDFFQVDKFGALVLDFSSLTSATPVQFDLIGGIRFDNVNFETSGNGPIGFISEVNDLNIEALQGNARFQGNFINVNTRGDINYESTRGSIVARTEQDLNVQASAIRINGNYDGEGVFINSNGTTNLEAGVNGTSGGMYFEGKDLYLAADGTIFLQGNGSSSIRALDKIVIDSDSSFSVFSQGNLDLLSNSGPAELDAGGAFTVQSTSYVSSSIGSQHLTSVLGSASYRSDATQTITTDDQVKFVSIGDITFQANGDVAVNAGTAIDLQSSPTVAEGALSRALINASDVNIASARSHVSFHSSETLVVYSGSTTVRADNNGYITAQGSLTLAASLDLNIDTAQRSSLSAGNNLAVNAPAGKITFDSIDDITLITTDLTEFQASDLVINANNDAYFQIATDVNLTANGQFSKQWNGKGLFGARALYSANSNGNLVITASSPASFNGQDGIDFVSGKDSTYTSNSGGLSLNAADYATYNVSGALRFLPIDVNQATFSVETEALTSLSLGASSFDSADSTTLSSTFDIVLTGDSYVSTSSQNTRYIIDNEIQLEAVTMAGFGGLGTASLDINSNTYFRYEVGDLLAQGDGDLTLTAEQAIYFYVRDADSFVANGQVEFTVDNQIGFDSQTVTVTTLGDLNVSADDLDLLANQVYYGDIVFRSGLGAIALNVGNSVSIDSDRFNVQAGTVAQFLSTAGNIVIQQVDEERSSNFGNILFGTNGTFTVTTTTTDINDSGLAITARTTEFAGKQGVSFTAQDSVQWTSTSAFTPNRVYADDTITLLALSTIQVQQPVIGVRANDTFQSISSTGATAIIATDDFGSQFSGNATITAANVATVTSEYTIDTDDTTRIEAATAITFNSANAGMIEIGARGGGATFNTSSGDITLTTSGAGAVTQISSDYEKVYFTALGSVANVTSTGTVLSMGGEHRFSSVTTTTLNANDGIFSSGNDGLISVHSDRSVVQNVIEAFSILGSQDNGEPAGRYGNIRTTSENGNLCIRTNSGLTNGKSTFDGSSVRFAATGDDSQLLIDVQGALAMTSAAAIDLSAFGFRQGDPEFLLSNLQYGILVRSNTGPIALSSSGSLQVVTDEAQVYRSANGGVSSAQTQDTDIRTTGFNATIIAVSNAAAIAQLSNANGVYTTGNALRPADFTANATRDIIATAGQDIAWNQLGVATLPGQPGIEQLTFGAVTIDSDASFAATAGDGGRIRVETEQGNAFITTTNNIQYTSVNGQTLFTGRGSATFDASKITLNAQGDGGNVRLESGSDQPLTFLANNGALTFTAQSGTLQVLSEDAMTLQIAQTFNINGDCLTVEGGSVTFDNAEAMTLTARTDDIYFRSNLEFTVDTTELAFTATEGQFILNAGGQNNAAGLAITVPVGDIDLVSLADTFLTTVKTSVTTSDVSTFTTQSGGALTFESRLDSNTQDSILLYSQTARVLVTSVEGGIFNSASVSNEITSDSLEVQTTDLTEAGKVVFSGDRLFELTIADNYSFELTGDFEITSSNVVLDIEGAFTATSTVDNISVAADSRLDITTGPTSLLATDDITVSFIGRNAVGDWTTTGNVLVDSPTDDIVFDAPNIFSVDALTLAITTLGDGIVFDSANYTLNTGRDYSLTVTAGDFTETAVGMLFTAETLKVTANAYTALTERVLYNAEDNITWLAAAGPIAFASAFTHEFEFWANNNLNIQVAGASTVTSTSDITIRGTGQAFTQDASSLNTGIFADNSASNTFVSKRDITFTGFTGYSFTANTAITLTAQGPGGVQLVATAGITATASTSATLTANNGNVFLQGEGEFVLTSPLLTLQTSAEEFGNIYIQTDSNSAVTATTLVFTDIPGNARAHDGSIEFNALQTLELKTTTLLSLNANDDVRFTSPVSSALSFANLDVSSSSLALHDASQTIALIATGAITLTTGAAPAPATLDSSLSHIQFKSNTVFLSSTVGDQTYTSADTIEINGPAALFFARNAFTVNTPAEAFVTAERADISVSSPTNSYTANNNVYIEALGTDGPVNIVSNGSISFAAPTGTIRVEAQGRIWAPYSTITSTASGLRLVSSSDAFFDGSALTFTSPTISFQTAYDGSFEIKSRGFVNYQAADVLNIRADGMLDNVNGRYVLSDAYYLEFGRFQQGGFTGANQNGGLLQTEDIRISRNTNGLEYNAVTGSVVASSTSTAITAAQGSISSRAQTAIRYLIPNGGFMRFFGINPGTIEGGVQTGTLRTIPFTSSPDYCVAAGNQCVLGSCQISCLALSTAINDILEALVAYGLVQCQLGSGFCF